MVSTPCLPGECGHNFPKVISPKINIITRVEFELGYFETEVQHFIHYATLYFYKYYFQRKFLPLWDMWIVGKYLEQSSFFFFLTRI